MTIEQAMKHPKPSRKRSDSNLIRQGLLRLCMAILLAGSLVHATACSAEERNDAVATAGAGLGQREEAMQIRISAGERVLTARLEDSATARDFAALLPLRLNLRDYASTEKIADLPQRLSTEGAPDGADPDVGDIAYYAPWGNLAIYYRDFEYSRGLVRLGRIESGVEELSSLAGPVTIEIAAQR